MAATLLVALSIGRITNLSWSMDSADCTSSSCSMGLVVLGVILDVKTWILRSTSSKILFFQENKSCTWILHLADKWSMLDLMDDSIDWLHFR